MSANLTPAYKEAEARLRNAVTREEKIGALKPPDLRDAS